MRRLVAGVAPFALVTVVYFAAVAIWPAEAPSIEVEDSGGRALGETTTSTAVHPAPAEGAWEALPTDHDVALGVLAAIPTTTVAPPASETRPAPSPDPAPAPVVERGGDSITDLICSYGWDCATAVRVFRCESGLDPNAVGSAGERGIAQVHPVHRSWLGARWGQMFDPRTNLDVAHEMWLAQGWRPWSCR